MVATLLLVAACSGKPMLTVEVSNGTQFAIEAAHDARYIDLQGMLWKLPAEGGQAISLTNQTEDIRRPHSSSDGQRLIFETFVNGYWQIGLMDLRNGQQQLLTDGRYDNREPAWSPDSEHIWFSSDRSGNEDIWALRLADGQLTQVTTDPAADYSPAPSDESLVFVSERSGTPAFYSLRLDAGGIPATAASVQQVAKSLAGKLWPPRFSPDGSRLAWVQAARRNAFPGVAENALFVLDLGNRRLRKVSSPGADVFSAPPSWLDNDTLLYTADGQILQYRFTTRATTSVPFRAQLNLQQSVYRKKTPLTFLASKQPALGIVDPAMLADGSIVFTALGDLWQLAASGSLKRLTNDAAVERDAAVSTDNRYLAFISDRSGSMQIWLRDLVSGNDRQLTTTSTGPRYPTFAPDGRQLAYQQVGPRGTQDFTLHVLDLETGASRKLRSAPALWPGRMSWSASGTHLTVAELFIPAPRFGDGANRLVRIDVARDIAAVESLSADMTPDSGPAGSPDGKYLALIINGALWLAPTQRDGTLAGPPRLLLDELTESPAWSADSQSIAALTTRGLETIAIQSGQRQLRNPLLTWSPSVSAGRRIVHATRVFDGRNAAYLQDMDILVDGARIVSVTAHQPHPPGIAVIDATGMTVLPGLIDHHVHFEPHKGERAGRALLAFGVTTVVEPGGLPYESREQLEAWMSGRRLGPRLVYAGPQLDGERRTFYFAAHVHDEQRLQWELERAERLGYGLLKTYRRLPPSLQARAVELGHAQGLPVTAHAALRNLGFGGDRSEHLRGSGRTAYSSKQSELLASYADMQAIFTTTGGAITPTLVNQGAFFDYLLRYPEVIDNRQYTTLYTATERQSLAAFGRIVGRNIDLIRVGLRNAQTALRELHTKGATIVAGTDSPIFPYGLALISELESYVAAGLTPAQALQTATSAAAQEMGAANSIGTLDAGMLADMVIVNGDPLTNINDLLNVAGILKNGEYHAQDELLQPPAAK